MSRAKSKQLSIGARIGVVTVKVIIVAFTRRKGVPPVSRLDGDGHRPGGERAPKPALASAACRGDAAFAFGSVLRTDNGRDARSTGPRVEAAP